MRINNSLFDLCVLERNLISVLIVLLFIFSCSQKIVKHDFNLDSETHAFFETQVMVFKKGEYVTINMDENSVPVQGGNQFYRDMYLELRYPRSARENNIQGSVLFELEINEEGIVESIEKLNTLSPECDEEAEKAIVRGCKKGFDPYIYKGSNVRIKYLIPVNFRLR